MSHHIDDSADTLVDWVITLVVVAVLSLKSLAGYKLYRVRKLG